MPTTIKGTSKCPECGSEQNVKHDGRKFFITCTDCRTMTSYQSKEAKARIEKRLKPVDPPPEAPETIPAKPKRLPPTPARVSGGFLDAFNDMF